MRPSPTDPTYEPALVRSLIATHLPALAAASIVPLARGWDCDVFTVGEGHVARLARNPLAARGLELEAQLLPLLATKLPLPVPRPVVHGVIDDESGLRFGVYEKLAGTPLGAVALAASDYDELAPVLGAFLRALHAVTVPTDLTLPPGELGRFDPARRSAPSQAALEQLQWEGGLGRAQRSRLQQALVAVEQHTLPTSRVLVHGDLNPGNLLIDEDGLCGVIDWIDVHHGPPAADLATSYLNFPEASRAPLFAAYGSVDASTHAWARWRAVTLLTAMLTGAQARGDGELAHRSAQQLRQLGSE